MSSSAAPLRALPWPPLITAARLPRWMVVRDVVLTLLAWILLGWLIRDALYLVYDFFRYPIFALTTAQPPDFALLWSRLRYFVILSASLILVLSLWAFVNRNRLKAATNYPPPRVLPIAEQAARFGIAESAVGEARAFKITLVKFREDGTIAGFESGPLYGVRVMKN